jgi:hypothetical protein
MQGSTADEHPLERTEGWEKVAQREESFEVRELGHQAQLRMKRDTTFVLMTSETLSSDQLAEIAARLEPAPDQSEV